MQVRGFCCHISVSKCWQSCIQSAILEMVFIKLCCFVICYVWDHLNNISVISWNVNLTLFLDNLTSTRPFLKQLTAFNWIRGWKRLYIAFKDCMFIKIWETCIFCTIGPNWFSTNYIYMSMQSVYTDFIFKLMIVLMFIPFNISVFGYFKALLII